VFGSVARPPAFLPEVVLSELASRPESSTRRSIVVSVRRSHFAVSHFLGSVDFPQRGFPVTFQQPEKNLSASSAFLQSITQLTLANRPQPASSSHGLLVPSAHARIEGPPGRELNLPTTFRLQGLITLLTAYSLRSLAGFVSHRQHSWDLPFGALPSRRYPDVSDLEGPTYRFACRCSQSPKRRAGPPGYGSWALSLPEVPVVRRWV
jgi:hypothetical protein